MSDYSDAEVDEMLEKIRNRPKKKELSEMSQEQLNEAYNKIVKGIKLWSNPILGSKSWAHKYTLNALIEMRDMILELLEKEKTNG